MFDQQANSDGRSRSGLRFSVLSTRSAIPSLGSKVRKPVSSFARVSISPEANVTRSGRYKAQIAESVSSIDHPVFFQRRMKRNRRSNSTAPSRLLVSLGSDIGLE